MDKHEHEKEANGFGGTIRELIFGLEDGIVSTGGAVIGIAAGTGDRSVVILSGLVIIVVEALSMAAGTYLSSKSSRQMLEKRISDERRRIEERPEAETKELHDMYAERGFSEDEVQMMVRRVTSNKELWLEEMVSHELGIGYHQLCQKSSSGAAVMWVAYTIGGLIPIVPFMLLNVGAAMATAFGFGLLALFGLGSWKAHVTGTPLLRGAFEMVGISAMAGVAGFAVGKLVAAVTGIDVTA